MGVVTETNAERAIEELKAYEADTATVLRDGRWTVLPAAGAPPLRCGEMQQRMGCLGAALDGSWDRMPRMGGQPCGAA